MAASRVRTAGRTIRAYELVLSANYPHANTVLDRAGLATAPKYGSNAMLAETVVPIREQNFLSGRYEWSQRNELFANNHELEDQLIA